MSRLVALGILFIAAPVLAESWTGKNVVVIKEDARIDLPGRPQGKLHFAEPLHVEKDLGDTLELIGGTVRREDVLPHGEATKHFTRLIAESPMGANYNRRALILIADSKFDEALADAEDAIRLEPKAAHFNTRAFCWHYKGEFKKAIADFSKAIELDRNYQRAWKGRAVSWLSGLRDYERALADANEALRLDPNDAQGLNNRGLVWWGKEDFDKAIVDLNSAIAADPRYGSAYRHRGCVRVMKEECAKALIDFDEALRLNPQDMEARNARGVACLKLGELDKAIADFSELVRSSSPQRQAQGLVARGMVWHEKGDFDKAIADYTEAIKLAPKLPDAYHSRAKSWKSLMLEENAALDLRIAERLQKQLDGEQMKR